MKAVALRAGERLLWRWHARTWQARTMGSTWFTGPSLDDALRQVLTATRITGAMQT